jgi:hypothetical protein
MTIVPNDFDVDEGPFIPDDGSGDTEPLPDVPDPGREP